MDNKIKLATAAHERICINWESASVCTREFRLIKRVIIDKNLKLAGSIPAKISGSVANLIFHQPERLSEKTSYIRGCDSLNSTR